MDEISFSADQHGLWAELYERRLPRIRRHACSEYLSGFDLLDLPGESIPTLAHLNSRITPATGWQVVRTEERFRAPAVPHPSPLRSTPGDVCSHLPRRRH